MRKILATLAFAALALPALAGEGADLTQRHLYAGTLADGRTALETRAAAGDQEARFGTGFIALAQGIETFAQALYRHGFAAPDAGPMAQPLAMPVPANANPLPIDYPAVRDMLAKLVADMDGARDLLLAAGESGDYVVPLDVLKIRLDLNGDGKSDAGEGVAAVLAQVFGADLNVRGPDGSAGAMKEVLVGFDRADAIWLAGYSQMIAAQADFLLAHDFHQLVDVSFHRLFPHAGLPMQDYSRGTATVLMDPESDNAIADAIAAIHTLSWPVVEPDRLKRVLSRFQAITALSRRNWQAILAETDDNHELVPNPRQTPIVPDTKVTDETVEAWMETLDTADKILSGELLVPHWRFTQGFDLKAYFETATHTDLLLLLTGSDALPYLRDGPIATQESFAAANRVFGDELLGYVFWFN